MLGRDEKRFINSRKRGEAKDSKDRLAVNFDPEGSAPHNEEFSCSVT